ncbi:MAG: hypothetical protein JXR80_01735 [Deltaproteobacteria bacterium]|nr:hypothetical protein [Deltaproteobacteria bacterium]
MKKEFDHYISLGDNCEAGFQFWRINYNESSIFRFVVVDSDKLISLIRSDFQDLFVKENLKPAEIDSMIRDTKTSVAFHSKLYSKLDPQSGRRHFRNDYDFDKIYAVEKSKVDYLVNKWRKLTSSSDRVLYFIKRNQFSSREDAEMVLEGFQSCYPGHNFLILYIQPRTLEEPSWGYEQLHNVYVDFLAPYENSQKGADINGWNKLFAQYPLKYNAL